MMKFTLPIAAALSLFLVPVPFVLATEDPSTTIAQNIGSNPDLSTLYDLLLTQQPPHAILSNSTSNATYTLFAPTNRAFSSAQFDRSNQKAVQALLAYHILPRAVSSSALQPVNYLETMLNDTDYVLLPDKHGQVVRVTKNSNQVLVNDANVTSADLSSKNGVVHIIDKVLALPPLFLVAIRANPNLTTFASIIDRFNMSSTIQNYTGVTLFAPTNDALNGVPTTGNDDDIKKLISYHIVPDTTIYYAYFTHGSALKTEEGSKLSVSVPGNGSVRINNASIQTPDILIANGVVHTIDQILQKNSTNQTAIDKGPTPNANGTVSGSTGSQSESRSSTAFPSFSPTLLSSFLTGLSLGLLFV